MASTQEKSPAKKPSQWQRWALISGAIITALLLLLLGTAAAVQAAYQGKIMPNTTVAGASLTGQDVSSATAILTGDGIRLANTQLTVTLGANQQSLTAKALGISLNVPATVQSTVMPASSWGWLTVGFWHNFFRSKTAVLTFGQNTNQLQVALAQKLALSSTPKDAAVNVANGSLVVSNGQPGTTIDLDHFTARVTDFFTTGQVAPIILTTVSQTAPVITTAQAATVAKQISQTLRLLTLTYNGKKYTVSVADQYTLLDYTTNNNILGWQVDQTKLQTYLQNQIAKKIDTTMIPQVTESTTNQQLTSGRNGVAVDLTGLTQTVYQAMTTPAASSSVTISATVTPFNHETVSAGYIPNLFPGLYIDINLKEQRLYVMEGGTVTNEFLISSGEASLPTPTGLFYICSKNPEARSTLYNDLWMPNWNALSTSPDSCAGYQGYGVHALPCFDKSCTEVEDANHLGIPISHGCVRLSDTDAEWFYQNIPLGTPINIHE